MGEVSVCIREGICFGVIGLEWVRRGGDFSVGSLGVAMVFM